MQKRSLIITYFIICSSCYLYILIERDVQKITQVKLYAYLCVFYSLFNIVLPACRQSFAKFSCSTLKVEEARASNLNGRWSCDGAAQWDALLLYEPSCSLIRAAHCLGETAVPLSITYRTLEFGDVICAEM